MILKTPAKVNLYLDVLEKREDGFHGIQSIFNEISLYDEIMIHDSDDFSFKLHKDSSPFAFKEDILKENLLEKIYFFFKKKYNINNLSIELKKKIPIGAGLGGGSSNAGYFLKYLNKKFNLNINNSELKKIGLLFGSDIPFFIDGGCAVVSGRGEIIKKIQRKNTLSKCFLVYPDIHINTKVAYRDFVIKGEGKTFKDSVDFLIKKRVDNNLKKMPLLFYNAFERRLINSFDIIRDIFSCVKKFDGFSVISGSGSSIVVFFDGDGSELKKMLCEKTQYVYDVEFLL